MKAVDGVDGHNQGAGRGTVGIEIANAGSSNLVTVQIFVQGSRAELIEADKRPARIRAAREGLNEAVRGQ